MTAAGTCSVTSARATVRAVLTNAASQSAVVSSSGVGADIALSAKTAHVFQDSLDDLLNFMANGLKEASDRIEVMKAEAADLMAMLDGRLNDKPQFPDKPSR